MDHAAGEALAELTLRAKQGSGYDLISRKGKDSRKIEVKAETGPKLMNKHAYALTVKEWEVFGAEENAWLYIVYSLNDSPKLVKLQRHKIKVQQIRIIAPQINIRFSKRDRESLETNSEKLGI